MSTVDETTQAPPPRRSRYRALQPANLAWLTVLWVALWGDLSVGNVVSGLLVAVAVCLVFPLPAVRMQLRLRPLALTRLTLKFFVDVVVSSVQVALLALRPRTVRNSVIEVNLRSDSDFVLTVVAEMTSLVPGSIVVEVRRSSHTLFLHVLDTDDLRAAESMRERTLELEQRVVAAFGAEHTLAHRRTGSVSAEEERR
ncbi:Na+/H+ antiporter subunit E [Nocardioides caldifontis]|uniref:Na+/H+ antiporter subunit E n=1 Tax=Nocardioides caldifontis TaxID=2588938 RepID=UPI0011DF2DEF|nr:Na+/H+ antiporter subunit E [Nocardioides caldifontis]